LKAAFVVATFLVVGVGAAGVGALNLRGADTLTGLTISLLAPSSDCGGTDQGGSIGYDGSGDRNGQGAMVAGQQTIAPMGRMMDNAICGSNQATAEGIVFELDGTSIVADASTFGSCNGANRADCTPDPGTPQGGL